MLFVCRVLFPFGEAVYINRFGDVCNIGERDIRIMREMFGLQRMASAANPSGSAFPDRMQDARTQPVFGVERRHATPDHGVNPLDEFLLQLSKGSDIHAF